jgi:transposase
MGLTTAVAASHPGTGRRYQDHRRLLNGILFRITTGMAWRDLPDRYGRGRPFIADIAAGHAVDDRTAC